MGEYMENFDIFRRIGVYDTLLLKESKEYNKFFKDNGIVSLRDLFLKSSNILYTYDYSINREIMAFINLCKLKYLNIPIEFNIDIWERHSYSYWHKDSNIRRISYIGFDIKKIIDIGLEVFSNREDNPYISVADILIDEDVLRIIGTLDISDEIFNRITLVSYYLKNSLDNLDILECNNIPLLRAKERLLLKEEESLRLTRQIIKYRKRVLSKKDNK